MSRRARALAALLPLLGLSALVVRSELAQRGEALRLAIRGYDPRDLISGHYLLYRYELDWQGESSCGSEPPDSAPALGRHLQAGCCLCFTRQGDSLSSPFVRQLSCAEAEACDDWLHSEQLQPPQRYYVPEERAQELERALAERKAAVDVVASPEGTAAVGELYIDGWPWREALERFSPAP